MKFQDYHIIPELKKRIDELGWKRPTDIQFKAIRHILKQEDVFAIAETGSGKTAAFVIPVIHMIAKKKKRKSISALIMVPTRELANQIEQVCFDLSKYTTVKSVSLIGGVDQDPQKLMLKSGVDIVIATPGRMFDLISQDALDVSKIDHLVLDEADLMLDYGFLKDIRDVMRHVPKKRQTLFFSATISKKIKSLAYEVGKNAIRIQFSPKNPVSKNVDHVVARIEMDDKRFFLENIVHENPDEQVLVFVRTKIRSQRVQAAMKRVGIDAEMLNGDLDQSARDNILDQFKDGQIRLLITTDVACRGIDLPNVHVVVNYDIPDLPENYVHRCGRTGRGNNKGFAISFCSDQEQELISAIEEYTGEEIQTYDLSKGEYDQIKWDSEDVTNNWQQLLDDANEEFGDDW